MLDLEPREKNIIIILLTCLVLGLGFSAYKKSHSHTDIHIGNFDLEKESLHHQININTAGLDELTGLQGVGKVLAERILEYRSLHGQFSSIEDLRNVKGIGPALFGRIKDDITIE